MQWRQAPRSHISPQNPPPQELLRGTIQIGQSRRVNLVLPGDEDMLFYLGGQHFVAQPAHGVTVVDAAEALRVRADAAGGMLQAATVDAMADVQQSAGNVARVVGWACYADVRAPYVVHQQMCLLASLVCAVGMSSQLHDFSAVLPSIFCQLLAVKPNHRQRTGQRHSQGQSRNGGRHAKHRRQLAVDALLCRERIHVGCRCPGAPRRQRHAPRGSAHSKLPGSRAAPGAWHYHCQP